MCALVLAPAITKAHEDEVEPSVTVEMKDSAGVRRTQEKRADLRGGIQERREDRMEKVKEIRERVSEQDSKHLVWKMLAKRAYIGMFQIEKLSERLDARIQKMEDEGVDVSKAETQNEVVKANIADAKVKLEALKTLSTEAHAAGTVDEEMKTKISAAKEEAKAALKKVHESMRELIKILRDLRPETKTVESSN